MGAYFLIANGPNLNLLGLREPAIYGTETLDAILDALQDSHPRLSLKRFQSNCEGAIIDALQQAGFDPDCRGIILNAGAYAHTSLAIADCIRAIPVPVVEVHLTNTAAREPIRHTSLIAPACRGTIAGFGPAVYDLALRALLSLR